MNQKSHAVRKVEHWTQRSKKSIQFETGMFARLRVRIPTYVAYEMAHTRCLPTILIEKASMRIGAAKLRTDEGRQQLSDLHWYGDDDSTLPTGILRVFWCHTLPHDFLHKEND